MSETRNGLNANRYDLSRLKDALEPALEFLATMLKPDSVAAFVMDPEAGRLNIACPDSPLELRAINDNHSAADHGVLRTSTRDSETLVRLTNLEANDNTNTYAQELGRHGYEDIVEFQFEDVGMFVGGITLFWRSDAPKLIDDMSFLHALHDFVQCGFRHNWRRTALGRRHVLSKFLDLTPRECDVVEMLCLGRTNQDAALCLGISLPTVKTHLASLFHKFEVENRTALIRRALLSIDSFGVVGLTASRFH